MRKLVSLLLILLVVGAGQAIRRHGFQAQQNKSAVKRIFNPPAWSRTPTRMDRPGSGPESRWQAHERRRR